MRHFIVLLNFTTPFEQFGDAVPHHRAFLQEGYDRGLLLLSGPQQPKTGGIVVARAESLEDLQAFFARDPYKARRLAEHAYLEFTPVKWQDSVAEWIQG